MPRALLDNTLVIAPSIPLPTSPLLLGEGAMLLCSFALSVASLASRSQHKNASFAQNEQ